MKPRPIAVYRYAATGAEHRMNSTRLGAVDILRRVRSGEINGRASKPVYTRSLRSATIGFPDGDTLTLLLNP